MANEKTKIISHTFLGESNGNYRYEITFNKSLQHTCRMDAITRALDRFDKFKTFWKVVYTLSPFKKLSSFAFTRF